MTPRRLLFALAILLLAAGAMAIRLPRLGQRPMHCDEANQAKRTFDLQETGRYEYNLRDQHGPSLCWFTLPVLKLRGVSSFAASNEADYRLVPVIFGAGLVLLLLLLADGLGRGPAILAALLTAISPAMVFYSRYYIQETPLVFFTLAAIGCGWRYYRSGAWGWAVVAGTSLGLMHANKETWVLAAAAMAAALVITAAWEKFVTGMKPTLARLRPLSLLAALAAACLVAAALYSNFGAQWRGPLDSLLSFASYWHRGTQSGLHVHPWYYYFQLLLAYHPGRGFFWSEGLIAALAIIGLAASFSGARGGLTAAQQTLGRFLGCYTLILVALYSAIPYKTPWCVLSALDGMILLAGLGGWALIFPSPSGRGQGEGGRVGRAQRDPPAMIPPSLGGTRRPTLRIGARRPTLLTRCVVLLLLLAGVVQLGWQCYALNFRFFNDPRNPWVYAQTSADALQLAGQMERLAQVSPQGHDMVIHVIMPDNFWPLPWYLRKFNDDHLGYWQDAGAWSAAVGGQPPPAVIMFSPELQPLIDSRLRAAYNRQMIFGLRYGVLVAVYVREDLWEALQASP